MKLIDDGVKRQPSKDSRPKLLLSVPDDLTSALEKDAKARATFDGFPPSSQRQYVEWLTEAKREQTRQRRLEKTIEWLAEGKRRNWKYENC